MVLNKGQRSHQICNVTKKILYESGNITTFVTFSGRPCDELSMQASNIQEDTQVTLFYRLEEEMKENVHCMTDFHV